MVDLLEQLVQTAPNQEAATGKWEMMRHDACINCGRCATACIYDVHKRDSTDPRWMATPESMKCVGCYNCLEVCPVNALEIDHQKGYHDLGGGIMEEQQVLTIWKEATDAKIPVTGGGYKGPFAGKGFDSMWTDMSEIVRPTRDGIHGREKIWTEVQIGRRPVTAKEEGNFIKARVPILFTLPYKNKNWNHLQEVIERAGDLIGTMSIEPLPGHEGRIWRDPRGRYLEVLVDDPSSIATSDPWTNIKMNAEVNAVRVWANRHLAKHHEALALADVVHVMAPLDGWVEPDLHLKDVLFDLHEAMVEAGTRNRITIIVSGGIHTAEHVPKAIIRGADAVVIDVATVAALGCRVCQACTSGNGECPDGLDKLETGWGIQRLVNLTVAWRDQLLEMMGAMGMKDVRRLRGEVGRAMEADTMVALAFQGIDGAPEPPEGAGGHH